MNYCTLFDSYYLAKGLALYESLIKQSPDAILYVMAFDDNCFNILDSLNLHNLVVENVKVIENDKLLRIKQERTKAEYCWTCGPIVIDYFIDKHKLDGIIYLDSDLFFIGNPQIAYAEVASSSIAITEQGISDSSAKLLGRYCVQYLYFKNDSDGMAALHWWRDACLDWCYQRIEENRYGDQKYLDQFPVKFNNVHVVKNYGVGIAPWNMYRYDYDKESNTISYKGKEYPAVFFHMHGLRFEIEGHSLNVYTDDYLSKTMTDNFFIDYLNLIVSVQNQYLNKDVNQFNINSGSWLSRVLFLIKDPIRSNKALRKMMTLIKK